MGGPAEFLETKIYTTSSGVEPVTALLMRRGVTGISVEDIRDIIQLTEEKGQGSWDYIDPELIWGEGTGPCGTGEAIVTFYIGNDEPGQRLLSEIKIDIMKLKGDEGYGLYGKEADFGRLYVESAPLDSAWKEKWKEGFKPFPITGKLAVRPPWEGYGPEDGRRVMVIDPGMAFGTGSHETTSMCAEAIEKYLNAGDSVLDVGTGSGILSIAASMLGAGQVYAVELDEDAARSAEENFERNGVPGRVCLFHGDIRDFREKRQSGPAIFDIIAANLTGNLLLEILPDLKSMLKASGKIILSGILAEDENKILDALGPCGLSAAEICHRGEWSMICVGSS